MFGDSTRVIQIPNYIEIPKLVQRRPQNYFLAIGRITAKKALDQLIRALSISQNFLTSNFILKIAGRGDEQYVDELRRLVTELGLTDKVEFVGQIEGEAKQQLFADAYWTFMPSHTENFGLVILESLAQNTPVLASTFSPWKSVEDERVGIWCDNDSQTLAQKIDQILGMTDSEYENYRSGGRQFVLERFDIASNIRQWEDFYSRL